MKTPGDLDSVLKNITEWAGLGKEWESGDCVLLFMRLAGILSARCGCKFRVG